VEIAGAFGALSPKDSKTLISSRPEIGVRSEIEETIALNEHEILQSFRHNSDGMERGRRCATLLLSGPTIGGA
jgi:hypothetical protein